MKTALVLGISGGFGHHVAEALQREGWHIRALMRDPGKRPDTLGEIEIIQGDASDLQMVRSAAEGVELMVYAINSPYHQWEDLVVPMLDVSARVAEEKGLLVLFPGNVYLYDPKDGPEFDEASPVNPPTAKGKLRQQMEQRLQQASEHGAKVIIIRAGDFFGSRAPSSWMSHLIKPAKGQIILQAAADPELPHTWSYLPDVATTAVALIEQAPKLPAFNTFHFPGVRITFNQLGKAMEEASGQQVKVKAFPWWALRIASPFMPMLRSLVEMRYLWQQQVNLNGAKLKKQLQGELSVTPLPQALKESGLLKSKV